MVVLWHVFQYDWAGRVYKSVNRNKSACNNIEQQAQLQGFSPMADRLGMLRIPRSVAQSQLHDLEQTLKAESLLHIFESFNVFSIRCGSQIAHAYSMCGLKA